MTPFVKKSGNVMRRLPIGGSENDFAFIVSGSLNRYFLFLDSLTLAVPAIRIFGLPLLRPSWT